MKKRIAIVGTHCTGKTTLIKDLMVYFENWNLNHQIKYVSSSGRLGLQYPRIKINEDSDNYSQLYFACKDMVDSVKFPVDKHVISDRCILDTFVYSIWLNKKGKLDDDTLNSIALIFYNSMQNYTHIVWLRCEWGLIKDGVRSEDEEYRKSIDGHFEEVIDKLRNSFDIYKQKILTLTGERDSRVIQFINKVWEQN